MKVFFSVLIICAMGVTGCSSAQKIESKPLPPGVDFNGKWYSPQYEDMEFKQKGDRVTATFSYSTGGTLEGTMDGNVLYFEWAQPGDFAKARRDINGAGYLVLADDGRSFSGRWGYDSQREGGGVWTGERVIEDEPEYDVGAPVFGR